MSNIAALVAGNLDIWTSATQRKSGSGRGGGKRISLYGIERLRALILDLAVRGKLVPQDAGDEPASKLLAKIRAAKPKYILDNGLPRSRALIGPIEQAPFDLPATWAWAHLGDIAAYIQRGKSPKYDEGTGIFVVSQRCVQWTGLDLSVAKEISKSSLEAYEPFRFLKSDDLLWNSTGTGTIGRVIALSDVPDGLVCDSHVTLVRCPWVNARYLQSWLASDDVYGQIEVLAAGSTNQIEWTAQLAASQLVPLPPLAEQRRIVAKVDELMALCDALERESADAMAAHQALVDALLATLVNSADVADLATNWARLETHFDTLFTTSASIKALQQTISALAVRGKLVEQDAGDEAAKNLLSKIRNARTSVTKTAKRDTSPQFSEHLKDIKCPSGWQITTLGEIFEDIHYGYTASADHSLSDIRLLRITDIQNGLVDWDTVPGCNISDKQASKYLIQDGDIMIARTGGTIGKTYLANKVSVRAVFASYLIRAKALCPVLSPYLQVYFDSDIYWHQLYANSAGTGQPNVNATALKSLTVPLPPLAEQHRIVAKVDALMALCDQLQIRLADTAQTQRHLADAITKRAAA